MTPEEIRQEAEREFPDVPGLGSAAWTRDVRAAYIAGRTAGQREIEALTKERDQLRDINRTAANFIDKMGDVLVFVHKYGTMPVSQEEECHQLALKASEAGELYKASLPSPPENR